MSIAGQELNNLIQEGSIAAVGDNFMEQMK
jgi:hypothetical protein